MKKGLLLILLMTLFFQLQAQLQVGKLSCENKLNPLGVESAKPALAWQLNSDERGVMQTAYRVLVSDNKESLTKNTANVWDSKKVLSEQSTQVAYKGKPLQAAKTYYWKAMVWDNHNHVSKWSDVAMWQMGLLKQSDWKNARWIAYEKMADNLVNILPVDGQKDTYKGNNILPMIRKDFVVAKPVKKATMFISGLGHFELHLNGKKVGDHFLDPGWTKYDKQALYVPFDVTGVLQKGGNAVGVMLGNGFYYVPPVSRRYRKLKVAFGYPKMICRMLVQYADGTSQNIVSDASWKTDKSPITFSSIYGGEDYDANLEQLGWNTYRFDDSKWKPVVLVDGPPKLDAQLADPLKVMDAFSPVKISQSDTGNWIYDLGQNASGIPFIKVKGNKGDTIRIYPGELLKEDGNVSQRSSAGPYYLQYILKGIEEEWWQPAFTYYGFRYLQVQGGVPQGEPNTHHQPVLVEVKGLHTRTAAATIGSFTCSNELFNRTFTLVDWAIKSNMVSVFTDCPHREKLGWLEQMHLMGSSVMYNYEVLQLFKKQLADMRYSQTADGLIPEIAPEYVKFEWGGDMFRDSPEWGSSSIILPWYLYKWYGDTTVLQDNYNMMKRYIAYLEGKANGYILKQGLGDWYDLGPKPPGVSQLTPMGVTGTAIFYYDLNIASQVAQLLNKPADAAEYDNLAVKVKQAFNDTFFNKQTKQYATGSQTANAMAVFMNLVEPQYKDDVVNNIVKDIRDRGNSLTAGDIGYRYLLRVLQQEGRSDVIYDMNSRSDVPGYGYQLAKGATALTESWSALPANSNNHFMLGHIMEWFYSGLGGIHQADNSVGFKTIVIAPKMAGDVTWANASFESSYGKIVSEWSKKSNALQLRVTVPPNTTAFINIPAEAGDVVTEGGKQVGSDSNISIVKKEQQVVQVKVGSGSYVFKVEKK